MNHSEIPTFKTPDTGVPGVLEKRAAEQRQRLHNDVAELRHTVAANDRVDDLTEMARLPYRAVHRAHQLRSAARKHVWRTAGIAATAGLIAGYGIGGLFL